MCGCSACAASIAVASVLATMPAVYASMVSSSEMGRLSVIEPGFGMGILSVCFALLGRILWISACSIICSIRVVHIFGNRPSRLSVKPWFLAFVGVLWMLLVRFVWICGACFSRLYVNGHWNSLFGLGGVKMWAILLWACMMYFCMCCSSL